MVRFTLQKNVKKACKLVFVQNYICVTIDTAISLTWSRLDEKNQIKDKKINESNLFY